jgi:hypothetical protein
MVENAPDIGYSEWGMAWWSAVFISSAKTAADLHARVSKGVREVPGAEKHPALAWCDAPGTSRSPCRQGIISLKASFFEISCFNFFGMMPYMGSILRVYLPRFLSVC